MRAFFVLSVAALVGCSSSSSPPAGGPAADAGGITVGGDDDAGPASALDAGSDAPSSAVDGGFALCDGGVLAANRFVTSVVSFTPGDCAGFGAAQMPGIVLGPPVGGGVAQGSTDVVSLGVGGSIVLAFAPGAIVDGPGADFIVFENAFDVAGNPNRVYAEPGEVSVSDDGVTWTPFPCTATQAPWGACAGWHPVLSSPDDCVSPVDPAVSGGDPFDLHDVGVARARFVRIVDKSVGESCPTDPSQKANNDGFDLDAIAIVNPG